MSDGRDTSLARCVEHVLGEPANAAPAERAELEEWLGARGLALVEIADPGSFSLAGKFLARRARGWSVDFGVPPGTLFAPTGGEGEGPALGAAVLVPLELGARETAPGPVAAGRVESIAVAAAAEAPMQPLDRVTAIAGRGLEGDRYTTGAGTFSTGSGRGRALTLVEVEAVEDLRRAGIAIDGIDTRRNLVVSGIDLDALIGRRFRVGAVECFGARRCEPCAHLQRLTEPGVLRGLVHRGGLRADILSDGEIRKGDEVVAVA